MPYTGRLRIDPDAALGRLRLLSATILATPRPTAVAREIAELGADLDEWLTHGGTLPSDWAMARRRRCDRDALLNERRVEGKPGHMRRTDLPLPHQESP